MTGCDSKKKKKKKNLFVKFCNNNNNNKKDTLTGCQGGYTPSMLAAYLMHK